MQVVRCFDDPDVHHVSGRVDPVRDIEVINTELILADLDSVKKRRERVAKDSKRGDKAAHAEEPVLAKLEDTLDSGTPALLSPLTADEKAFVTPLFLLTMKPTIFACNVKDAELATADDNPYVRQVRRLCEHAPGVRSGGHQRADRERTDRPVTRGSGRRSSKNWASRKAGPAR